MTRRKKIVLASVGLPLVALLVVFWRPIIFITAVLLYTAFHKVFD